MAVTSQNYINSEIIIIIIIIYLFIHSSFAPHGA
jgi:hypothetical protein